jgi:hypothetical protein
MPDWIWGEVLLTAGIFEVFCELLFAVLAGNILLRQELREPKSTCPRKLRGFSKRQKAPRIQGDRQLLSQALFGFTLWYAKASDH